MAGAVKAAHDIAPSESVPVHELTSAAQPEFHAPGLLFPRFAEAGTACRHEGGGGGGRSSAREHIERTRRQAHTH